MPRVNHVKHARALYHTKPDLDADGNQKVALVFKKDGVTPKTDKRGKQIERRLTVRDLTRPKPNLRCDFPGCDIDGGEILPGTAYKFLALRFGQKNRHAAHPNWHHWEYSSSVAAQAAQVQHGMHESIDSWEPGDESDFDSMASDLESEAQGFADERQEALDNMPEQLQDGSQAQEYAEAAESWPEEFSGLSAPDAPFHADCEACDGGQVENDDYDPEDEDSDEEEYVDCGECDGTGESADVNEDWIEEARETLREAVDALQI